MTYGTGHRPEERPPLPFRMGIFAVLVSSGIVLFEPAPTDMLFFLLAGAVLLRGGMLRTHGIGAFVVAGISLFLLGNGLSMLAAVAPAIATRYLAITIYMVLLFVGFAGLIGRYGPRMEHAVGRAFCLATILVAGVGILARFQLIPHPEMFYADELGLRIQSTFKDPNVFGPFVVAGLMLVLNDYLVGRRSLIGAGVFAVVLLFALLIAFSRGAVLHFAVSLLVYAGLNLLVIRDVRVSGRLITLLVVAGGLAVLVGVTALATLGLEEFVGERFRVQGYDTERFAMQELALHVAADNPIGLGPGEWKSHDFANDPHNVYLRVLAENGLVGLIGWVMWFGGVVVVGIQGAMRRGPLAPTFAVGAAVIAGAMFESLFIDTLHWRHMFLIAAMPVGLRIFELATSREAVRSAGADALPAALRPSR
ncbi:MAG: O-antigen ligase family protein [Planctomycetes bacterium]|nr:O-antigen ligase family protein [Planctomycetota bacterium]MCB9888613.1 O-antigen ligase family protein [Planctomycetota bacterium]